MKYTRNSHGRHMFCQSPTSGLSAYRSASACYSLANAASIKIQHNSPIQHVLASKMNHNNFPFATTPRRTTDDQPNEADVRYRPKTPTAQSRQTRFGKTGKATCSNFDVSVRRDGCAAAATRKHRPFSVPSLVVATTENTR